MAALVCRPVAMMSLKCNTLVDNFKRFGTFLIVKHHMQTQYQHINSNKRCKSINYRNMNIEEASIIIQGLNLFCILAINKWKRRMKSQENYFTVFVNL